MSSAIFSILESIGLRLPHRHIRLRRQETEYGCGHACVAMVANISFSEAVALVGKKGATCTKDLIRALTFRNIVCGTKLKRLKKGEQPPSPSILKIVFEDASTGHWVVFWNGKVYDPEDSKPVHWNRYESGGKITSYLWIYDSLS